VAGEAVDRGHNPARRINCQHKGDVRIVKAIAPDSVAGYILNMAGSSKQPGRSQTGCRLRRCLYQRVLHFPPQGRVGRTQVERRGAIQIEAGHARRGGMGVRGRDQDGFGANPAAGGDPLPDLRHECGIDAQGIQAEQADRVRPVSRHKGPRKERIMDTRRISGPIQIPGQGQARRHRQGQARSANSKHGKRPLLDKFPEYSL